MTPTGHADLWTDLHGGATHFPIALALMAAGCEGAAACLWGRPEADRLRDAGGCAIVLAALATLPAVASGLVLSKGGLAGTGVLRWHHLFVWPSFAVIVGTALWRLLSGRVLSRSAHGAYVAVLALAGILVSAAGYWGGELLKSFP